jgi:hypothetical protein
MRAASQALQGRRTAIRPEEPTAHLAVWAWGELSPDSPPPEGITRLSKKRKSRVYRLSGVTGSGAVIAKRCRREAALLERSLYEDVLAKLPVTTPEFRGCVAEEDGEHWWLFLEEATGERYSSLDAGHRRLAAEWLGAAQATSVALAPRVPLPERGSAYYMGHLRSLRDHVTGSRENPLLKAHHLEVLESIASRCALIESRWDVVVELCERFPRTLVHGDLSPKNVRVRRSDAGSVFLPFDWESAGWGIPAADVSHLRIPPRDHLSLSPDLDTYWELVREVVPGFSRNEVDRLAALGALFRLTALMDWASWSLSGSRPSKAVRTLGAYLEPFASAGQELTSV